MHETYVRKVKTTRIEYSHYPYKYSTLEKYLKQLVKVGVWVNWFVVVHELPVLTEIEAVDHYSNNNIISKKQYDNKSWLKETSKKYQQ